MVVTGWNSSQFIVNPFQTVYTKIKHSFKMDKKPFYPTCTLWVGNRSLTAAYVHTYTIYIHMYAIVTDSSMILDNYRLGSTMYVLLRTHFQNLLIGPWEFSTCHFQTYSSDWWLRLLLWNCPNVSVTGWLVHVMPWCRQATSHYLNHCWRNMASLGQNELSLSHV